MLKSEVSSCLSELQTLVRGFAFAVYSGVFEHPESVEEFALSLQTFSEFFYGLKHSDDPTYVSGEYGDYIGLLVDLKYQLELLEDDERLSGAYWYKQYQGALELRREAD
ncbi:MAG: hypothetical protein A2571_00640 [Candidatus Vogelbacteria bacterium RIFOXYD1_FULL_44_32]|uniref:Uncharacterized protein n=1 Tax=Candidatus Vogelbacteria bacterium RIFOXYD1_FULL_44_32 TaxID=1802438 RepID=A0A1G2QE40_9BACT|nr:MAG: hypothetical protein A2571_00640 [Candidatus Vogelbacteria bacterium RIFOXYD1_FULL_44_32]